MRIIFADPSQAAATAKGTYVEIVGNGTDDDTRSNARTLDWSGNETLAGDITVNKDTENEMALGQAMADLKNDYTQKIVKDYYTRHFWGDYTGQLSFTVGPLTIMRLKNHFTINGTLNASDTSSSHYYIALSKEVAKCNKFNAGNATIDPYLYFEDGASYKISTVNPSGTISTDGQVQLTLELIRQGSNNALCAINSSKLLNSSGGSDWFLALDIWIMSGESVTFNSYKFDIYVSKADNLFSGALTIGDGSDNEMTITAEQMTTLKNTVNALPKILSGYAVSTGSTGDLGHINVSFGDNYFQSTPVVVATAYGSDTATYAAIVHLSQVTTTGFKALTFKTATSANATPAARANSVRVYWIAIGT